MPNLSIKIAISIKVFSSRCSTFKTFIFGFFLIKMWYFFSKSRLTKQNFLEKKFSDYNFRKNSAQHNVHHIILDKNI